LKSFIDNTAKGTPTPGGGSVAALVGSLGAALLCMAGNFTAGKPKYKSVQRDIKEILREADKLKESLFVLIGEDMKAYEKFSQASQMPKDTSLMREKRRQVLQEALKEATEVPWRVMQASLQVIELAEKLLPKGNPNLLADVGVGVLLAEAALKSAVLNVKINLSLIKDEGYKSRRSKIMVEILSQASQIKEEVLKVIQEKMDG
jgi:glutamate formiminotransferase/formiminotetrahydrofolate cyclodeaminase